MWGVKEASRKGGGGLEPTGTTGVQAWWGEGRRDSREYRHYGRVLGGLQAIGWASGGEWDRQ